MTSGGSFTFGQSGQSAQPNQMFGSSLFGQPSTAMASQPTFAFGGTSMPTTTSSFTFPAFGQTMATTASTFGTTSTPFTFTNPSTANSSFNFGAFGGQPSTAPSLFSATRQQTFNFGSSLPTQQQQQVSQLSANQVSNNIFSPKIYNDERDEIIAQFNRIQAFWGTGKAYYSAFMPPFEITQTEPIHRFKAIGYSEYKRNDDDMNSDKIGVLVKMSGDESQLKTSLLNYEANMKSIIGSNYSAKIEITKVLSDNKAVLSLSVVDPTTNKNISAVQLQNYLNQANVKTQLNNIFMNSFINLVPLAPLSKQELEEYLNTPPKGIDERLWNQAKIENPDPNRFIPVPLVGFAALNERFKLQERETQQHKMRLKLLSDHVCDLERHVSQTQSKLGECRRKHIALSNRILKIMITQEVLRKRGYPIQAEEDQLRAKLESIESELSAPTKFQGCINEMMSQLRQMQNQHQLGVSLSLDNSTMNDIKAFLKQEKDGISQLLSILKNNLANFEKLKSEKQVPNL